MNNEFQNWCLEQLQKDVKKTGEIYFPQYSISVKWIEDIVEGQIPHPKCMEGLPLGRFYNSTGMTQMHKEEKSIDIIQQELFLNWWPEYQKRRPNADSPVITVQFYRFEVWCLNWFNHWSFDVGFSDDKVLESFQSYVCRIQRANEHFRYCEDSSLDSFGHDHFCLMGAEDRWRWKGNNNSEPPCRCEHCKQNGIVRIDH